jgi:hypothetical protein
VIEYVKLCRVVFILLFNAAPVIGATIFLKDIDSGLTSPTGDYRWMDVANQAYSAPYQNSYNYTTATVEVDYIEIGRTLKGTLNATNLKPNFAYQIKLSGYPGTISNENIGFAGRWWQEEWNGSAWINGQNLNNKGNGSSPNPNDITYFARYNVTDITSPTGLNYKYTGYLVFDYFLTDENGSAILNFEANSSHHVLWKTSQRTPDSNDGVLKTATFDPNITSHEYDFDYGEQTVSIFGEWERLPMGGVFLDDYNYTVEIILTEESFHGTAPLTGTWAAAMGAEIQFFIDKGISSGRIDLHKGWNLISLPIEPLNHSVQDIFASRAVFGYDSGWFVPTVLDTKRGYWLYSNETKNISVIGKEIADTNLSMHPGWNLIGYPHLYENIMVSNNSLLLYNGTWQSYIPNRTDNSLTILKPGLGYWVWS